MNSNFRQPLEIAPAERVTLDQLKHRAEAVSTLAVREGKRVADEIAENSTAKVAIVVVAAVVITVSLAYFLGTGAGRRKIAGGIRG